MATNLRVVTFLMFLSWFHCVAQEKPIPPPSYDYDIARSHEIKPHRRTIPVQGMRSGFNQLHVTLTISPTGDVLQADASGEKESLKHWPEVQGEVQQWKFTPFEHNGKAVTAEIEEYVDLVPPERLPKTRVVAPPLLKNSRIAITLRRSGCYGRCPSYSVTLGDNGVLFEGGAFVVAAGKHRASIDRAEIRQLAERFIVADFYSMDSSYSAMVTDNPTYEISITIDGHEKKVEDYVGQEVGMPSVVVELEDAIDEAGRTQRWIAGSDGLVDALRGEKYNFQTFEAQAMLKEAASNGMADTVRELLDQGVTLEPIPQSKGRESFREHLGWLSSASRHADVLQILLNSGASKNDQRDKDQALALAARAGNLENVRALIAYGSNPNADLSRETVTQDAGAFTSEGKGAGSILIYAADSGNPDVVREILLHRPKLDARDDKGRTTLFAAAQYGYDDKEGARAECVRLLVQAGADVNARDEDGNTPLHETFLAEVEEELLSLGADVNARNNDGETPIFTTVDDSAITLFLEHGADLSIRNNDGETVMEAAKNKGPARQEALQKAIQNIGQK